MPKRSAAAINTKRMTAVCASWWLQARPFRANALKRTPDVNVTKTMTYKRVRAGISFIDAPSRCRSDRIAGRSARKTSAATNDLLAEYIDGISETQHVERAGKSRFQLSGLRYQR